MFFHATHAPMKDLQAYSSKCSPTPLNFPFPSRAIGLLGPITWGPSARLNLERSLYNFGVDHPSVKPSLAAATHSCDETGLMRCYSTVLSSTHGNALRCYCYGVHGES